MRRNFERNARQTAILDWAQYIALVLAFIGLWQMLSGGITQINHWF